MARLYIEANWANLELDFGDYRSALHRSQRCIRAALRQGIQDQYMEGLLTNGVAHLHLADTQAALAAVNSPLAATWGSDAGAVAAQTTQTPFRVALSGDDMF